MRSQVPKCVTMEALLAARWERAMLPSDTISE
jgi:hypothetical protein